MEGFVKPKNSELSSRAMVLWRGDPLSLYLD